MQEIRNSNPAMVTGICDPNRSRAHNFTCSLVYSRGIKETTDMKDGLTVNSPLSRTPVELFIIAEINKPLS